MRRNTLVVWLGLLPLLAVDPLHAESTPKPACPSLSGEWVGEFEGSYVGDWSATFSQSGNTLQASASITLESGQLFEAEGTAGTSCEGAKTALAGTGSAKEKSGSFSGISDDKGTHLTGTWWSGDLAGTWRGSRSGDDDASEELP